jgi:hypothetical protein
MDVALILGSAVVAVGLIYFIFFRETRSYSGGAPSAKSVPLEPLVPRDFTLEELKLYDGRNGRLVYLAGETRWGQLGLALRHSSTHLSPCTVDGIVFNMSSHPTGPSFYGPGGPYEMFAGESSCAMPSESPFYVQILHAMLLRHSRATTAQAGTRRLALQPCSWTHRSARSSSSRNSVPQSVTRWRTG